MKTKNNVEVIDCDKLPWNFAEKITRVGKAKCQSDLMSGYSGCMCTGCAYFRNTPSPWVVGIHGSKYLKFRDDDVEEHDIEIFVARKNYHHAFASWGWGNSNIRDSDAKIMILDGEIHDKKAYELLIDTAKAMARRLNKQK